MDPRLEPISATCSIWDTPSGPSVASTAGVALSLSVQHLALWGPKRAPIGCNLPNLRFIAHCMGECRRIREGETAANPAFNCSIEHGRAFTLGGVQRSYI